MLRPFSLVIIFVLLPQLAAQARLGQPYSIDTFQPYFQRGYNTLLGWKGYPVQLTDPHVYLYQKGSARPKAQVEFLYRNQKIHTEILKLFQNFKRLDFEARQELNWFLLTSTDGKVNQQHLHKMQQESCATGYLAPYYLTLYTHSEETLLKISLHQGTTSKGCSL